MTGPAPDARLRHLDGWRGLSLVFVLVGHFSHLSTWIAPLGVEMFFVLSGRLMAELLVVRRQPLPHFLWRRVSRIWPGLWTYVGVMSVALAVSALWGDHRNALAGALASLTFTQNYLAGVVSVPYFDHVWSLSVEEHCYLLLALVTLLARGRAGPATAGALLLTAAAGVSGWWQIAGGTDGYYTYLRTDTRAGSVLLPFALYLLAQRPRVAAVMARLPWLSAIAFALGCWCTAGPWGPWRFTAGTLALAVAVVSVDRLPAPCLRRLGWRPLALVGTASFSLYLWQQPFMLLWRAGTPAVLCLIGAGLSGWWSFARVEQPARRRLNAVGWRGLSRWARADKAQA